jgi:hypothetical protein
MSGGPGQLARRRRRRALDGNRADLSLLDEGGLRLAVVTFLSALASLIPARNASRSTVREVLAYE